MMMTLLGCEKPTYAAKSHAGFGSLCQTFTQSREPYIRVHYDIISETENPTGSLQEKIIKIRALPFFGRVPL